MNKNTTVETAKEGQATKKNNKPVGKTKTLKAAQERKVAREKEYRNFRINSLKRRAKRMGIPEEDVPKLVEKLVAQLDAPKEYSILIMFNQAYPRKKTPEGEVFKLDIDKFLEDIENKYVYKGNNFVRIDGNQEILAKIREIAPNSAKIYMYAKKAESVFKDYELKPTQKKPTNNTQEAKYKAKSARKELNCTVRAFHKKGKGKGAARKNRRFKLKTLAAVKKRIAVSSNVKPISGNKEVKKAA